MSDSDQEQSGWFGWLRFSLGELAFGCLLFSCVFFLATSYLVHQIVAPNFDVAWEKIKPHLPWAMEDTLKYFLAGDYPYLPGDVELPDDLKARANAYGFTEYDLKALIAGAQRFNIRWEDVVAIQINAQWHGGFRDMFFLALAISESLDEHYNHDPITTCPEATPTPPPEGDPAEECFPINPRHEAIKALNPSGGNEWLNRVLATSDAWKQPLKSAIIRSIDPDEPDNLMLIFLEMLSYRIKGYYNEIILVDGQPVIVNDPEVPAIPYPDVITSFFANPFPGSSITGYCFGCPVYNEKGELIREHHPGVDLGGIGSAPVYAAHEGEVIYAGWMNSGSLWISGIVVGIRGTYPDGTQVCTLYGHGTPDTLSVDVGRYVYAGDQLFIADNTGFSFGTHLHFDLRFGDGTFCAASVNPSGFVP